MKAILILLLVLMTGCMHYRYTQPEYLVSVKSLCRYGVKGYRPDTGVVVCKDNSKNQRRRDNDRRVYFQRFSK